MTRILSIIVLTSILLQSFGKVIIYVNYELNLDYIIRTYCVNKSNPAKHCDGKCHLTKQLQEEEKQESTPGSNQNEKVEIQWFSQEKCDINLNGYSSEEYTYPTMRILKPKSPSFPIFHPPTEIIRISNSIV